MSKMFRLISARFAVRSAVGSRARRAFGFAPTMHFTSVAASRGTLSTHADNVRDAIINGAKRIVWIALNRHGTKIGMKTKTKNDAIQLV
jgi:hypothetical protein